MKILTTVLAFTFALNSFAAVPAKGLEQALDEFQYFLTVDWDGKDDSSLRVETAKFEKEIGAEDISRDELTSVLKDKVNNPAAWAQLESQLSMLSAHPSQDEVLGLLKSSQKDLYAKGASWDNEVMIGVGVLSLGIAGIAMIAWAMYNVGYSNGPACDASDPSCSPTPPPMDVNPPPKP